MYIRQVSPRAYFLCSQNDVIASFFVWRVSVQMCFSTVLKRLKFVKTTFYFELYFNFHLFYLTSGVLWRPLDKEEGLVATLWLYLTPTLSVRVVVTRG